MIRTSDGTERTAEAIMAIPKKKAAKKTARKSAKKGPCWNGYERTPGTTRGAKGSCRKK